MPKTQLNGIDIYYETYGAGDPLLLISGFACDHGIWSIVAPILASRYRVIVFDNRGMGQSSRPETASGIRQMADDAAGLLDALGLGSIHVAGHSMGGMIAQELALAYPERIRSLLLLASCAHNDERGRAIIEAMGELPGLVDAETGIRLAMPWMYTSDFYANPGAIDGVVNQILTDPFPPSVTEIYNQSRAISSFNTSNRLYQVECPTLVLVGRDHILLPLRHSEQLARSIRRAELVVLEKTGHGLLIESPEMVANAMLDFLSRGRALDVSP